MEEMEQTIGDRQEQVRTALRAKEIVKNLTTTCLNLEDQVREVLEKRTDLTRELEDRPKQLGERTEDCKKLAKQMEETEQTISDLQEQVHTALGAKEMVKNLVT